MIQPQTTTGEGTIRMRWRDGAWSDDERARATLVLLGEEALEGEYRAKADTFVENR